MSMPAWSSSLVRPARSGGWSPAPGGKWVVKAIHELNTNRINEFNVVLINNIYSVNLLDLGSKLKWASAIADAHGVPC
jgi:hypothetical protein